MAENSPDKSPASPDWSAQVVYLRELAGIVRDESLSELEVESDGIRLSLKAPVQTFAVASTNITTAGGQPTMTRLVAPGGAAAAGARPAAAKKDEGLVPVVSPMVGVFYRAPSPADPNFVEVGDRVERGQTIGLVEAMKVFNEIAAESAGVVAEIVAATGDLVETGGALIRLKKV